MDAFLGLAVTKQKRKKYCLLILAKNTCVKKYFFISKKGIDNETKLWYTFTEKEAERSPFSPCRKASTVQYSSNGFCCAFCLNLRWVRRKKLLRTYFFGGVYQLAQKNFR